ncbi:Ribonuclease H-like protein [Akanthomyces lecanii RCEF 1005]|uniref:Ribonuclease H-like protein n=1 Tax=Akanthomyces lecanii RCEF 1005 TaxID=1081108 RepID=A0A168BIE0_CORDF|nr:Ribonuclease H-like protein [Akanthomyces lecanii RCEF 1005]
MSLKASLKHIACPAGSQCSAFECLFGSHGNGTDSPEASTGPSSTQEGATMASGSGSNTGGVREAMQLDRPEPTSSATVANPPGSRSAHAASHTSLATSIRSIKRPVSPAKPKTAPAPTAAVPVKQESLNPRLLKHSPASHEMRLKLVKMLHKKYTEHNDRLKQDAKANQQRLILSDQAIITRVLDEEEAVAVGKAAVYSNIMKNIILKYTRLKPKEWISEREKEMPPSKKRQRDVMEGNAVIVQTGLTSAQEVTLLRRLLTPVDALADMGYVPRAPTEDEVAKSKEGVAGADNWEECDRCAQRFQVFVGRRQEDGALTSGGACNFHWGKMSFPEKVPGDHGQQPKVWLCCGEHVGDSVGCFTHPNHVFKANNPNRLASVLNFATTPENPAVPADRAVCFDGEMGYTVYGMELIRLTATSWPDGAEILDVLVCPLGEILDLNTRFSGVKPDHLAQAEAWRSGDPLVPPTSGDSEEGQAIKKRLKVVSSPAVARDLLFSLLSPSTPLIGHGLENDLNSVRIIHPTLFDTVLAFPHKKGLPSRNSLKQLMSTLLNRKIQEHQGSDMVGHDSAEDARAAGELARLKVAREWADMKRAGWKVVDGEFVSPTTVGGAGTSNSSGAGALTEAFIEKDAEKAADEWLAANM